MDQRLLLQPCVQLEGGGRIGSATSDKGRRHEGRERQYWVNDVVWYVLPDYEVEGTKRKLYCRLATSNDVKKQEIHGHNSQYYRWMINKQKLGNYVKKKAHHEIMKTKSINRTKKYHQSRGAELKKDLKAEDKR